MLRRLLVLAGGLVAAGMITGSAAAFDAAQQPVPSLTPVATERLWSELVRKPRVQSLRTAECRPLRAVFYAPTDWRRLATKLAATPSPCAQYYISVPPVGDKTQQRADEAWRIRALGPAFHALAEISVTGWTAWVASTGRSWYEAGVEARRRMAMAGYDVTAGDTWALNELSSAVRQGVGNARANMRAFLNGLYDGDGALPAARGTVFIAGIGQATTDLSLYQARLQDWYEDAGFWTDLSRFASDWSQEVYGDVRHYAVAGATREARRDLLNEYLQHQSSLAGVAPTSADAARTFLAAFSSPLANAAWRYDAAFGWTDVPAELMQDYVSAETYAMRAAGTGRFGYAWSPKTPAGMPEATFDAQTDALLVRLAAAIADSGDSPEAACAAAWCTGSLDGATATAAWRTFGAWKPSRLAFTSPEQTVAPGAASTPLTVELQTSAGTAYTAGVPVTVALSSSTTTGELATTAGGPWTTSLATPIASGTSTATFYYRDTVGGSATITAATAGKTAATQAVTVGTTLPSPPVSPPPSSGGGGSGPAPDLVVQASATPAAPAVGNTITYVLNVRNLGGPASRALLAVQLPSQVAYAGSQSDRGPGCTGAATLACDLDFLAGDLVATVRISAVVREPGTLAFTAVASAQPGDSQPANDTARVTTVVAPPATIRAPAQVRPALRAVGVPTRVTRAGGVATLSARFSVGGAARLVARVTTLRSTRPITLLARTSLAGTRTTKAQPTAAAKVSRAATYLFKARIGAAKLVRGRTYLVRLSAVDADGRRRTLTIRVKA
ncbi:MAG TPA: DUF11 domain-containing protein [Gaiellaceae bacterium]|nr:DUF11 domain-containing protein [Gaiellaceae bacterium]